jgi:hypothetical protein
MFDKISMGLKGNFIFALILFMYIAANSMERDYFALTLFWLYFIVPRNAIARMVSYQRNGHREFKPVPQ